ncbi:ferrochelatase [Helicobacter suis]|uniref:ferrochelatase n=1 Tax=Helicobacter suis TaxID=104628 RepID=UPI0013D76187|nr:ferrochelatase [Helicobacter suis]
MSTKEAVVLLNMGGPNHLAEVALFLKNMFADPCILSFKNPLLRKILGSFIVKNRLQKAQDIYKHIGNKSPINDLTARLTNRLNALDTNRHYTYAMRYTPPFTSMVFNELAQQGFNSLVLFSMYPQYSTTTTQSSMQEAFKTLETLHFYPNLRIVNRFYTHLLYNEAIIQSISKTLQNRSAKDFVLIFSVHGLPESMIKEGDPYQAECLHQVSLLKRLLLPFKFKHIELAYQSKVGPLKWLEPSTESMIEQHRRDKILIYPLAFSIDNSETLFELQIQYKLEATRLAVPEYLVCPCLNDHPLFIKAILELVENAPSLSQDFKTKGYNVPFNPHQEAFKCV